MWQPFLCGDVKLVGTTGGVYHVRRLGARPRGLSSRSTVAWLLGFPGGFSCLSVQVVSIQLFPAIHLSVEGPGVMF